ncbi:hypothetical protein FOIG_16908 [Fusarium odoratissimum NRRL 54006]|uniref:Uncharacterized protein n=2 Tax=Fusarium oxysporum species complex TaxID=171631 RepID=X0ILR1_FUSO5|nr:uncharacterized protein FOIG_16908 [Fusarium odoratissimum NRRL 54006]EXL89808.1 hypothetical protein FOIG_16908 [Fusarium odoratissimum NRRL 54006]TXB97835.1 hypothetical protein FocTR4_00017116 [Fusarium oxysporum f. sp. cubense]
MQLIPTIPPKNIKNGKRRLWKISRADSALAKKQSPMVNKLPRIFILIWLSLHTPTQMKAKAI